MCVHASVETHLKSKVQVEPGYEDGKGCCETFFRWEENETSGVDNVGIEDQPIDSSH